MELHANKPGMIRPLHDFRQSAVWRHAREDKSALFQQIAIMGVHFIAMAVSLADVLIFIDRSDDAIPSQFGGISAKAHGAAQIAARFAFLQPFFTHPFRDRTSVV